MIDLFTHFEQRLVAAGGECMFAENLPAAALLIVAHPALERKVLVIPPGFADRHPWGEIVPLIVAQGIEVQEVRSAVSVADAPAGLSNAELAISETGSVLLAENTLEARIVSMLTLTHFVLVRESNLVPMLEEAGEQLRQLTKAGPEQRRYISLVTGPSRTADIERTLTIGVQGPKAVCVLIIRC